MRMEIYIDIFVLNFLVTYKSVYPLLIEPVKRYTIVLISGYLVCVGADAPPPIFEDFVKL